jgi:hypothetical protein
MALFHFSASIIKVSLPWLLAPEWKIFNIWHILNLAGQPLQLNSCPPGNMARGRKIWGFLAPERSEDCLILFLKGKSAIAMIF